MPPLQNQTPVLLSYPHFSSPVSEFLDTAGGKGWFWFRTSKLNWASLVLSFWLVSGQFLFHSNIVVINTPNVCDFSQASQPNLYFLCSHSVTVNIMPLIQLKQLNINPFNSLPPATCLTINLGTWDTWLCMAVSSFFHIDRSTCFLSHTTSFLFWNFYPLITCFISYNFNPLLCTGFFNKNSTLIKLFNSHLLQFYNLNTYTSTIIALEKFKNVFHFAIVIEHALV